MEEQVLTPQFRASPVLGKYDREEAFISHYDIKRFIKRHFTLIAISTLFGAFAAVTYVFFAVPLFTSHTQIIIDPSVSQAMREPNSDSIFSIDNAQVESQIEVLKSEKIATQVIAQLKLEDTPEFGGVASKSLLAWGRSDADSEAMAFVKKRITLARFQGALSVRRVGLSYAIDILFTSANPELAAKIANATAEAYIAEQINARAQSVRQSGEWLEQRIDQLRKQMNDAALTAQEFRAKRDYQIVAPNERGGDAATDQQAQKTTRQNTMEELDSTAQTYRRIYESYLMAYTESVQKQSYPVTNARIITAATPPLAKSYPKTKLILAFGALMGCLIGLALAFFRNRMDRSIWTPRQVREEVGIECLANIPRLPGRTDAPLIHRLLKPIRRLAYFAADRSPAPLSAGIHKSAAFGRRVLNRNPLPRTGSLASPLADQETAKGLEAVATMPFTDFSLGIKQLKTAISLAKRARGIRSIAITSSVPGEGKTTVAANLALLFATSGVRTLLVDSDLHHASLSRLLARDAKRGLVDAISGKTPVDKAIVHLNHGLDLLPVGQVEAGSQSDAILGSDKAQKLVADLKERYEFVIFEIPPLTASLDGLTIGSMLDCTLLLAEWGKTSVPLLSEAIHILRNADVEILGVAINKTDVSTIQYGEGWSDYNGNSYVAGPVRRIA